MLTRLQLRELAWQKMRSAVQLADGYEWDTATYVCGLAVEMILKARVCVDKQLPGWPETDAEFDQFKPLKLKTHDLSKSLNMTTLAPEILLNNLDDWGVCLQWNIETRYQPSGTATPASTDKLIMSAEAIIREICAKPGLGALDPQHTADGLHQLWQLEREISIEKGPFTLFALIEREETERGLDLVVSAPWIDAYTRAGMSDLSARVKRVFDEKNIMVLSGLVALAMDHPLVVAITSTVGGQHLWNATISGSQLNGVNIKTAYIITSINPKLGIPKPPP